MANSPAKSKAKRKALSQHGVSNKKKKTVIEENSIRNNQNNGGGDNFQIQIREKFEEELKCNICTEILIKPTVLNCSHMFCEYCIIKWKKQQERCPICRERIESQIRVLALDVFIEKALEVLTPEETKARAAIISQRERKNDLEEREEEEEEAEENTFLEDSSDNDWFSSDESADNFLVSDSYSEGSSEDFVPSDENSDRYVWSEDESSFNENSDSNSDYEDDSEVG